MPNKKLLKPKEFPKKLSHPSCTQCKRMAHYKSKVDNNPRYFCIGKRVAGEPLDKIDEYNFCIYTPFKGVVHFQIYEGDLEIWIALMATARKLILKDKKVEIKNMNLAEGWLECMFRVFTKEAK